MNRSGLHPKLVKCIDEMMSDMVLMLYYYGEFCQFINFEESNTIPRAGVSVDSHGMVFYWNRKFFDELPQKQVNFIVVHEIFHLLFDHPRRTRRGGYHHDLSNVAQDMCINQAIYSDLIDTTHHSKDFLELPTEITITGDSHIWVLMMPKEYKGDHVFEDLYEWLKQEKRKYDQWKKEKGEGQGHGNDCNGGGGSSDDKKDQQNQNGGGKGKESGEKGDEDGTGSGKGKDKDEKKDGKGGSRGGKKDDGCPVSDYLRDIFDGMEKNKGEFLDSHVASDVSDEFRKETIDKVQKYLRSRGLEKANIKTTLGKLQKSRKDYLREIKTAISSIRGYHKEKSITKRNRRSIEGIKGRTKEGFALVVLLDVSGSMGGYFQRALSYIFQNKIQIFLIQCDTEVKKQGKRGYLVIKNKSDFKKVQIQGLGGTTLQPGLDFIADDKMLSKLNVLILTDGYTDNLDVSKLRKTLILSIAKKCGISRGIARQICVENDLPAEEDF